MDSTGTDLTRLQRLIQGYRVSRMLGVAAELGIADRVPLGESVGVEPLAIALGVQPDPLLRLCRALAGLGVFTIRDKDEIGHSCLSLLLRTDRVPTLHYAARFATAAPTWAAWGALGTAMQGLVPFEAALGRITSSISKRTPNWPAFTTPSWRLWPLIGWRPRPRPTTSPARASLSMWAAETARSCVPSWRGTRGRAAWCSTASTSCARSWRRNV